MKRALAVSLLTAVFAGFLAMWSPARWAVGVSQAAILTVAVLWACGLLAGRFALPGVAAAVPLLGILACGAAQLAFGWTVYRWQTSESILYWFTNLMALIVASSLARDPAIGRSLLKRLFIGGVALAVISVIQNFTTGGYVFWMFQAPYREDVWGPFLYHNQYAAFIELLLPIACVRALAGEHNRWPYLVITAGLFSCIVATASRAGLAVATAELIATGALLLLRRMVSLPRLARAYAPLLLLAAVFAAVVGPETVWARLQLHDPYSPRRDMTLASGPMLRDRPVTGFGLGTWPTVYPGYAGVDDGLFANQAHNDWAQIAVEAGIPGLLCFAALFAWSVWAGWRRPWALGLSFVLVHALVDYPLQRQALGVFFFVLAGIVTRLRGDAPFVFSL